MAVAGTPSAKKRSDPRPRPHDGAASWTRLRNQDPSKHYVYVSLGDPDALAQYEYLGYERELLDADGVQPAVGKTCKPGDVIEMRGHVLMSISREDRARIDQEGPDGQTGWALADRIENAILDKRGAIKDTMRGLHGRYVGMEHDVQGLERLV